MTHYSEFDVLILGSGTAGLTLALQLADTASVAIISKNELKESASLYAQGGISVVLDQGDTFDSHINDTLTAGAGLCNESSVRYTVEQARESIDWLIQQGVCFTRENTDQQNYHLTKEGGHSHRRVIHSADATGKEVETSLLEKALAHRNISLFAFHIAIDLVSTTSDQQQAIQGEKQCYGCYVLDIETNQVEVFTAPVTVLATGGAGKVYLYTSNPDVATGDGIAMGWRAGCDVVNMEFVQFHPTCLYHPKAKSFLISEALRGEGARLISRRGEAFMSRYHPQSDLAPRDVVARAIDQEMKRTGDDCVYLDIRHKSPEFITAHFPTIHKQCLSFGIDMTKEPIPVVPAAHYTCGGLHVNQQGETAVAGLYAIGETAHTGLHGANRMASNSLLECLVYGRAAAAHIKEHLVSRHRPKRIDDWDSSRTQPAKEAISINHNWDELRRFMWDYVGIVRSNERLIRAQKRLLLLKQEINEHYHRHPITADLLELRNLADVADLIIRSALARKESRGLHYTLDYPKMDQTQPPQNTVIYGKS